MRLNYDVDFNEVRKYFTVEDSGSLYLYNGLESGNIKILQCRFRDRRIYFVNGGFRKGKKVLEEFRKKGWLNE